MSQKQTQSQSQSQAEAQSQSQSQSALSRPTQLAVQTLSDSPVHVPSPRPVQPPLLARYAESILWLARYMERVENLARLLNVGRTVVPDERDGRNWVSILRINGDEDRFRLRYDAPTGQHVTRFYLLDRDNPTSIIRGVDQIRENARTLRALISTEMWAQINVFHGQITALTEADIAPQNLSGLCSLLRDGVQAHTGVTEGTFYRDQSWCFYSIGRHLERADQMTRLVDITYAALPTRPLEQDAHDPVSSSVSASGPGTPWADGPGWDALLRAADGYHAYRRVYPHGYSAASVAGFLLLDGGFPRSVSLNLAQLSWHLDTLRSVYGVQSGTATERLQALRGVLGGVSPDNLLQAGLSPFLDSMQREFGHLQMDLAGSLFPAR